jgi:glycosyltransferase involved in cell wall biosynthesis
MKMTVIVPTYRRPSDLYRCLEALKTQERPADQVLVTVREDDSETNAFLQEYDAPPLPLQVVRLTVSGVVAAMNAGLGGATGDIVVLTDDDAVPQPDWLARIADHFVADERLGGIGGRDRVHHGSEVEQGAQQVVGKVQWYGRVIGNHHIGVGPAREVEVLKGVNCAFRITALRPIGFDTRLRGTGAQVHWELSLTLSLRRVGWKLIYDPAILVEHYPAARFDEDQREKFDYTAQSNAVFNETLILLEALPIWRRFMFLLWAGLIGTHTAPGMLQFGRLSLAHVPNAWNFYQATFAGRVSGMKAFQSAEVSILSRNANNHRRNQ